MGYPMTFKRLVSRNGLAEGDYDDAGWKYKSRVNLNLPEPGIGYDAQADYGILKGHAKILVERIQEYENGLRCLLGDLRRLEQDTVDEKSTCQYIAHRTGIEPDIVAAVLKEFMAW